MTDADAAIAAIARVAGPADAGGSDNIKALFKMLIAAFDKVGTALSSASSSNSTWLTTQPNNLTAQGVGSGAAQFVNPSVSALGIGGNLVSATYTAFKMDETGIYLFGKKLGDDPFKKDVERLAKTTSTLVQQVSYPHSGLLPEMAAAKARLTELGSRIKAVEDLRSRGRKDGIAKEQRRRDRLDANLDQGRIKGGSEEFTRKQIDSLERSIKLLAEAIGI